MSSEMNFNDTYDRYEPLDGLEDTELKAMIPRIMDGLREQMQKGRSVSAPGKNRVICYLPEEPNDLRYKTRVQKTGGQLEVKVTLHGEDTPYSETLDPKDKENEGVYEFTCGERIKNHRVYAVMALALLMVGGFTWKQMDANKRRNMEYTPKPRTVKNEPPIPIAYPTGDTSYRQPEVRPVVYPSFQSFESYPRENLQQTSSEPHQMKSPWRRSRKDLPQ